MPVQVGREKGRKLDLWFPAEQGNANHDSNTSTEVLATHHQKLAERFLESSRDTIHIYLLTNLLYTTTKVQKKQRQKIIAVMTPTLYHVPKTISSPIYQAVLELGLAPSTIKVVSLTFADLKSKSHLAINPMGTSPAFQEGEGTILWESGAVLNYLLEQYDMECKLYAPSGSVKRAKYLQLQQYVTATVYPFAASLYIHSLKNKTEQDESYMTSAKAEWRDLLAPTLTKWLADGPYFLGYQFSVVDLLVCKPLSNINSMDMLDETPALSALFDKISARPTFKRAYGMTVTADQPQTRSLILVPMDA